MTRDEILNIPAGREFDALIHQHIFNEMPPREDDGSLTRSWTDGYLYEDTFYSTDIVSAWKVVEKVKLHVGPTSEGHWYASNVHDLNQNNVILVFADTAPLAICRAALLIAESS